MHIKYCFYKYRSPSVSVVFTVYRLPEHRLLLSPHLIHPEILEAVHEQLFNRVLIMCTLWSVIVN